MLVSIAMLSACGGGGGGGSSDTTAGIGGTGIAVGKVTDFGSIFVNGSIFDINQAQFLVDGEEKVGQAGQDDLSIGMVVLVKAETNNGVFTGKALEVFYDDEVEGPVAATPVDVPASNGTQKTFTIFGQTITIDETGTIFEGTTFAGSRCVTITFAPGKTSSSVGRFSRWCGVFPRYVPGRCHSSSCTSRRK